MVLFATKRTIRRWIPPKSSPILSNDVRKLYYDLKQPLRTKTLKLACPPGFSGFKQRWRVMTSPMDGLRSSIWSSETLDYGMSALNQQTSKFLVKDDQDKELLDEYRVPWLTKN